MRSMPTSPRANPARTPGASSQAGSPPSYPEQIRTNLNKSERCQAPRPDREAARIAPEHREKTKAEHLNTVAACARRSTPHLASPLEGGRDELGLGGGKGLRVGAAPVRPSPTPFAALPRLRRPRTPGAASQADHTLNNPEQIRTNLNKPERCRTPRPDREVFRIAPEHPEKNKPEHLNTVAACARCSTPHLTSPLEGGRDELGFPPGVREG